MPWYGWLIVCIAAAAMLFRFVDHVFPAVLESILEPWQIGDDE